ncbi:MAG: DUF3859 domain-containing protein [Chitinophagaceae bacterium]
MKIITFVISILVMTISSFGQRAPASSSARQLEFIEIKYGVAKVVRESSEQFKNSPSGERGNLSEFSIIKITDSVQAELKANFGVEYMIKAMDTVNIDVEIEWIFPEKIKNEAGKKFKSIKYTTQRPTNIETASSYSLDKDYEMVKGKWKMNIYVWGKLLYTRTFVLY